jgi:predicted RND superfamily exporter protein
MLTREFIESHPRCFDLTRIKRTFNAALEENGFERSERYEEYFRGLSKAFSTRKTLMPSSFEGTEIGHLFKLFTLGKGKPYKLVTYIIPQRDLWSRSETSELKETIISKLEDKGIKKERYRLTGANLLTGYLKETIIKNLKSSMWLAGLIIIVMLLVYYRNLKSLVLSTLPLIVGLVTLSGIMVVFRLNFNYLSLIVLPMIIGIGIDDGVHLVTTFSRTRHSHMLEETSETGRAVVLTSLTTLVGFGSIALSHYPGLRSMGYVACIGIGACLFASIILLPALFSFYVSSRKSVSGQSSL